MKSHRLKTRAYATYLSVHSSVLCVLSQKDMIPLMMENGFKAKGWLVSALSATLLNFLARETLLYVLTCRD